MGVDFDLFVIGGGINGCGIARDAAGRGLRVGLAEMGDLGSATSSASTKLFHGGLRYLEFFEFSLVRKALVEREVLLRNMPHISWPMRFVLPYHPQMRFDGDTPTSRLLARLMPWMKGRRPAWLIRLGLFLYDHLGGRQILPATAALDLGRAPEGAALQGKFVRAYEYSDCWIEDSRLVVLNARDAANRGAQIMTHAKVVRAQRLDGIWQITVQHGGAAQVYHARALVNAAGPWVEAVIQTAVQANAPAKVRLVRGSHIVTRKLFDHDKAYFFQGIDGRIIFAIPYETDFTLIGTTDAEHGDLGQVPQASEAEQDYLCAFASQYFARPVTRSDIVWTYAGVRPLYDDGAASATAATRDYVLSLDVTAAPVCHVFGGKITTYRKLAQEVMAKLTPLIGGSGDWTADAPLPGGDFAVTGRDALMAQLRRDYPFLTQPWALRLVRAYGTQARVMLGDAASAADLGVDFGATLTAREISYLIAVEFASCAQDIVWRRSKLGLRLSAAQIAAIDSFIAEQGGAQ